MVRNHYNQQERLRHFSRKENGHDKLTYVDLKKKQIGTRNVETSFYEEGLYSDELEKELNYKIETPGMKVFDKAYRSGKMVILTRSELETMKKYLLIQDYRNPPNISQYRPDWEGDVLGVNQQFIHGDENYKEYVYRMMHDILNHSWMELLNSDEIEIRNNAQDMHKAMTLFVRSARGFVINDIGSVTERRKVPCLGNPDEMKNLLRAEFNKMGIKVTDDGLDKYMTSYDFIDNFTFYPISSNMGIIVISKIWSMMIHGLDSYKIEKDVSGKPTMTLNPQFFPYVRETLGIHSEFLEENFIPCISLYKNEELQNADPTEDPYEYEKKFEKYMDPNDKYLYPVVNLDPMWAEYLNLLTINEAQNYFAFGKNLDGRASIKYYQSNRTMNPDSEFKNDLSWVPPIKEWNKPLNC